MNGAASSPCPFFSFCDSPDSRTMAMRPASDSETPFMRWNCWDPVSQNMPGLRCASAAILMCGSSSGAYWISSISTGAGKRCMNRAGSSFASSSTSGSSSVTYRLGSSPASAKRLSSVVFPT